MEIMINTALVKELRLKNSWSQEHLAQVSGLSHRTVQRIERDGTCSFESLKSLAVVFEMTPSDLEVDQNSIEKIECIKRGRKYGYLGALSGFLCACAGTSISLFNEQINASDAGVLYGLIGAFCGICCAIIGRSTKMIQDEV